jgi:hypothetical protein
MSQDKTQQTPILLHDYYHICNSVLLICLKPELINASNMLPGVSRQVLT